MDWGGLRKELFKLVTNKIKENIKTALPAALIFGSDPVTSDVQILMGKVISKLVKKYAITNSSKENVKVNKKGLNKTLKFDSYMILLLAYFATSELMYFIVDNAFNAALEKNYYSAA